MDEREGKPSASGMERLALCPGSLNLVNGLNLPDESSKWAESGEVIHAHVIARLRGISTTSLRPLTPAEADVAERCQEQVVEVLKEAGRVLAADTTAFMVETERRLWACTVPGMNKYSGQFDLAFVDRSGHGAVIIDLKTGWGNVEPAENNLQLATLACLSRYGLVRHTPCVVIVAIVQPALGKPTIGVYDTTGIEAARKTIEAIVGRASDPFAPRCANPKACKYCPAKIYCKEAMNAVTRLASGEIKSDWPTVLEECEVAQLVIDDLREKAKKVLVDDPTAIPGWKLAPGAIMKTVTDTKKAYQAIGAMVDRDKFMACCSLKVGDLSKLYAEAEDIGIKEAHDVLMTRFEAAKIIETKQKAPSLKRAKATIEEP